MIILSWWSASLPEFIIPCYSFSIFAIEKMVSEL